MRYVRTLPLSFSGFPAIRLFFLLSAAAAHPGLTAAAEVPKNLAVEARVSASSQFSDAYRPQMAASGVMPSEFQPDGGDWAVRGTQNGWFELQWDQPVEAAQIVYYARTTSPLLECFKDYAVYLNGEPKPAVQGTLEHRRGPQKIALAEAAGDADPHRVPFVASRVAQPRRGGDRRLSPRRSPTRQLAAMSDPAGREDARRRWRCART